jgi:hypothetical protein
MGNEAAGRLEVSAPAVDSALLIQKVAFSPSLRKPEQNIICHRRTE